MINELRNLKRFIDNLEETEDLYKANELLIDEELIISVINRNNSKLDKKEIAEYIEFKIREDEDYLLTTYEEYENKNYRNCRVIIEVNNNNTSEYNIIYRRMEKVMKIAKEKCFSIKEVFIILENTSKCKVRISKI